MCDFDHEESYEIDNGEVITIGVEEDSIAIRALNNRGESIGEIELQEFEDGNEEVYLIQRAYMNLLGDQYSRQGIGRRCLEFFKEIYCFSHLIAVDNNGQVRNDGAHLTQDGLAFINAMRREGIIES